MSAVLIGGNGFPSDANCNIASTTRCRGKRKNSTNHAGSHFKKSEKVYRWHKYCRKEITTSHWTQSNCRTIHDHAHLHVRLYLVGEQTALLRSFRHVAGTLKKKFREGHFNNYQTWDAPRHRRHRPDEDLHTDQELLHAHITFFDPNGLLSWKFVCGKRPALCLVGRTPSLAQIWSRKASHTARKGHMQVYDGCQCGLEDYDEVLTNE